MVRERGSAIEGGGMVGVEGAKVLVEGATGVIKLSFLQSGGRS
jgi:hypothetical protein